MPQPRSCLPPVVSLLAAVESPMMKMVVTLPGMKAVQSTKIEMSRNIGFFIMILQFSGKFNYFLFGFLSLLLVNFGTDEAHVLYFPVVADVTEFSCRSVIDTRRIDISSAIFFTLAGAFTQYMRWMGA